MTTSMTTSIDCTKGCGKILLVSW